MTRFQRLGMCTLEVSSGKVGPEGVTVPSICALSLKRIRCEHRGLILCPVFDSYLVGQVLKINPVNDTTSLIGTIYGGNNDQAGVSTNDKSSGAATGSNGKVYCMPYGLEQILKIDPGPDFREKQLFGQRSVQ